MNLTILWNRKALTQFSNAIKFIENDSLHNAGRFNKEILEKIDELLSEPERYALDKYKINNDGSYRAFEIFSYRISYRHIANQIRIIRVRHTKMNPQNY